MTIKPAVPLGVAGHDNGAPGPAGRRLARRAGRADRAALEPRPLSVHPLDLAPDAGTALIDVGFLDTSLLITPVSFAVRTMGTLVTCVCLLLLFYTVESLERERSTRLAAIAYATPIRTGSLLLGKSIALAAVALAIVLAVGAGRGRSSLLIQQKVGVRASAVPAVLGAAR